ncbi:putative quinol monooxygenase [Kitasatospora sp. NPDC048239]|uniref:putative quinol monooxygenase n=1 Tax=Kitasatospora sp. NPDC048239 TaxID=3364046 RepID=UPI00371F11F2
MKLVAVFLRVKKFCESQRISDRATLEPKADRGAVAMGFGLVVRFTAHDEEAANAFDALAAEALRGIHELEPGTLVYANHTVAGEPAVRVFYELYRDRDAFEAHEQQPHVKRFLAERGQFLRSFEVTFLNEVASKGTGLEGSR